MNQKQFEQLIGISKSIQNEIGTGYDIAFILGSGYGDLIEERKIRKRIYFKDIPKFPDKVIVGQRGEILTMDFKSRKILFFSGRFHYYQGYSPFEVTLPVRISKMLGVRIMIITNAAGGINCDFKPGDIMIIKDHINLMKNPLIGFSVEGYDLFVDMSNSYSERLRNTAINVAEEIGAVQKFKEGIYVATTGPSYETKAEIEFFKRIGADAVGMSTVPEVIAAVQEGIEIFAISVITNMAAGISKNPLNHEDVLKTMSETKKTLYPFFMHFLDKIIEFL